MPAVPMNATRSFSLLLVVVAASGFSTGSAPRRIAGAAKVAAAAALPIVLTKDRRDVELPESAIFLLRGSYRVVTLYSYRPALQKLKPSCGMSHRQLLPVPKGCLFIGPRRLV